MMGTETGSEAGDGNSQGTKPSKWKWALDSSQIFHHLAVPISILCVGFFVESKFRESQLNLETIKATSSVIEKIADPEIDLRRSISVLSALGPQVTPHLVAILASFVEDIEADFRLGVEWPLPKDQLSGACGASPRFASLSMIRLQEQGIRARKGWIAGADALRSLGPQGIDRIIDILKISSPGTLQTAAIRLLLELRPIATNHLKLASTLKTLLRDKGLTDRDRGDVISILSVAGIQEIQIINGLDLDLSCRKFPHLIISGVDGPEKPSGVLDLSRSDFPKGVSLLGVEFGTVLFENTQMPHSLIKNTTIGIEKSRLLLRPTTTDLNFNDSTVTDSSFSSLDLTFATFVRSIFNNVRFFDCRLGGARFDSASFRDVVIEKSVTTASFFNDIWVEDLTFRSTPLSGARVRVLPTSDEPSGARFKSRSGGYRALRLELGAVSLSEFRNTRFDRVKMTEAPRWLVDLCRRKDLQIVCHEE